MLCLVSTLLMQLKVGPTKHKKATAIISSLDTSSLWHGLWIESTMDLLPSILFECTTKEFQFCWETYFDMLVITTSVDYMYHTMWGRKDSKSQTTQWCFIGPCIRKGWEIQITLEFHTFYFLYEIQRHMKKTMNCSMYFLRLLFLTSLQIFVSHTCHHKKYILNVTV